MFDDLRAGDGTLVAVASKNDLLEATQNAVLEAIGSRPSTSIDLASLGIIEPRPPTVLFGSRDPERSSKEIEECRIIAIHDDN